MAPVDVVAGAVDGSGSTEVERAVKEAVGEAKGKAVGPSHVASESGMVGGVPR